MKAPGILLACLGGFIVVNLFFVPRTRSWDRMYLFHTLGAGLGVGLASLLFFLWLNISNVEQTRLNNKIDIEILSVLLAGITIGMIVYRVRNRERSTTQASPVELHGLNIAIAIVLMISLLSSIFIFVRVAEAKPEGEWDAWAIWNLHARFLFRGGNTWQDLFNPIYEWSRVDYPLLTSSMIAFSWKLGGNESFIDPILLAALFTFGTASLVFSSLYVFRGFIQAALATIVILSTPTYILNGVSQYADIPLGFYYLATIVLLIYGELDANPKNKFLVLAGIMLGFSAWTKNEGLGFLVSVIVCKLSFDLRYKTKRKAFLEMATVGVGFLPVLAVVWLHKNEAELVNYMFTQDKMQVLTKFLEIERYRLILRKLIEQVLISWGGGIPGIYLLLLLWGVMQGLDKKVYQRAGILGSMILLLTLAVYLTAYIMTPIDLEWQLNTSLNRLLAQLFPSAVFCTFLLVRSPFTEPISSLERIRCQ